LDNSSGRASSPGAGVANVEAAFVGRRGASRGLSIRARRFACITEAG
jgi:hypothetical protein